MRTGIPRKTSTVPGLTVLALIASSGVFVGGEPPAFPLKISDNHRYLVDSGNRPFFLLGDTPWFLQQLPLNEVIRVLDDRKAKGFNTLFLEILDDSHLPSRDAHGNLAFEPEKDITRPVEAYWRYADTVIEEATLRGFFLIMSDLWFGAGEGLWMHHVTPESARVYGHFLGKRYARLKNLMWMHCGDRNPDQRLEECTRELARAIREEAPGQLHTAHLAHESASAAYFARDPWLDVNMAYTYGASYLHVAPEYARKDPVRPLILGETGYEDEPNAIELLPDARKGDLWTPYRIRRNAYWAVLSGASGYCAGTRLWRFEPNWREVLDAGSSRQAPLIRRLFESGPWWRLVPDLNHELVTGGYGAWKQADYVTAARADDGSLGIAYLPSPRTLTVNLAKLARAVEARWFDPTNGRFSPAGDAALPNSGPREFAPSGKNGAGEDDWVLLLEATGPGWSGAVAGAADFQFRHHSISRELPLDKGGGGDYGLTALVDLDRDGDLDFVLGGRFVKPPRLYWFEFQGPDRWVEHLVGTDYQSDVGLAALDVDGDGWMDLVTSGVWYRNTRAPRAGEFERRVFDAAASGAHDIVVHDMDGDRRPDVVLMGDERTKLNGLRWYAVPRDPASAWEPHDIGPGIHGAISPAGIADLDGDGDADVLRGDAWFENRDGRGREWIAHPNIPFGRVGPFGKCVRTVVADLDGDGRQEVVMADADITDSRVVVLKNADGKGGSWLKEELPRSFTYGSLHSLAVADLNGDGRPDIVANEQEELLPAGRVNPRWVAWKNLGQGRFAEVILLDAKLGGHELVAGDVDGDGDTDICSKPWGARPDNGAGGRMHVDYLENLLKAGKKAEDRREPRKGQ